MPALAHNKLVVSEFIELVFNQHKVMMMYSGVWVNTIFSTYPALPLNEC